MKFCLGSVRYRWKRQLKISKFAKFENDTSEASEYIALRMREILLTFERHKLFLYKLLQNL